MNLRTSTFLALLVLACGAVSGQPSAELVSRGKYLASAGGCAECHTAKNGSPLAGGLMMDTPFGPISTPNITPDRATGIGNWTDEQFYRALHDGIGRDGKPLYPVMPFPWYTNVAREDVLAIKAYLFSLPPVPHPRPDSHLAFPFNIRTALYAWRELFFKPANVSGMVDATNPLRRGAYLVNGLGHCGECHDSRRLAGASRFQKPLQGGVIDNWYAPNITSDVGSGIGGWSDAQIVQFLKTGSAPGKGVAVGPMADVVHSLSSLNEGDLEAVAAYLKSTPGVATAPRITRSEGADRTGANVYLDNCASCHGLDGRGLDGVVPALAGNGAVQAQGPQNVVQTVLGGLQARAGYAPMLAIGAGMEDNDVAAVTNYVRQRWGNAATATASASMVAALRPKIDTPMTAGSLQACATVASPSLARALGDSAHGIGAQLEATAETNMPQQVARIVPMLGLPANVPRAAIVNDLTAAYCRVVVKDSRLDPSQRTLQLGHFSEMVYTQLSQADAGRSRRAR